MFNRKMTVDSDLPNQAACAKKSNQWFKMKLITRNSAIRLMVLATLCLMGCCSMTKMPGKSYRGALPALTDAELLLRGELVADINTLAVQIGDRNMLDYKKLQDTADFIDASLTNAGYRVRRQNYTIDNKTCSNIEAEIKGVKNPEQIVIIGAHYDTAYGTAGANDNGSGTAAVLAIARKFAGGKYDKTLRFVLFVNEEPPYYHTDQMGSRVYAKNCRTNGDNIVAMLSLETIGYYCDTPKSQKYPFPFSVVYPSTGNFVGFLSDMGSSRKLLHEVIGSFRRNCQFPSEGGSIPSVIAGVNWSDHWSFWQEDYPAIMITDTAIFRYPYYHSTEDTPDKIDYDNLARVVSGLKKVIAELTESI